METRCSFDVFDTTSLGGNPDEGVVEISFSGNLFDGNRGTHWAPDELSAKNPISIETGHFRTGWAYDSGLACVKDEDFRVQLISPYAGQIAEKQFLDDTVDGQAFIGAFGAQLPSLWDILNQGPAGPRKSQAADGKGNFEQEVLRRLRDSERGCFPMGAVRHARRDELEHHPHELSGRMTSFFPYRFDIWVEPVPETRSCLVTVCFGVHRGARRRPGPVVSGSVELSDRG